MKEKVPLLFEDKPLFGLDIGHGKLRVLQASRSGDQLRLAGYGETLFDPTAITDGVITKPELIAQAAQDLFRNHLVGDITTNRVAMSMPIARAFTRSMEVPKLKPKELAEAVHNEAEQYIPAALDTLHLDYTRGNTAAETTTIFIVAMPKTIVESYLTLGRLMGLETVVLQTSSGAGAHLFDRDPQSDVPSLLIDFGSDTADITVYDHGPVVSGTVAAGSELLTAAIARTLGVTDKEATLIKAKYGLGVSKKQPELQQALEPTLSLLVKEIKRTARYYEEHAQENRQISQVIIAGGGANMPGLADYLTSNLRMAVRAFDPSAYIDFGHLQPFNLTERMSYVTATGLASINPKEVFA